MVATRKTEVRPPHVSPVDRAAARRSLERLKIPTEVLLMARGSEVEYFSVLHMVEMLMDVGRPLSPALRKRLDPWVAELTRRRERLLVDNRRANARFPNTSASHAGTR